MLKVINCVGWMIVGSILAIHLALHPKVPVPQPVAAPVAVPVAVAAVPDPRLDKHLIDYAEFMGSRMKFLKKQRDLQVKRDELQIRFVREMGDLLTDLRTDTDYCLRVIEILTMKE